MRTLLQRAYPSPQWCWAVLVSCCTLGVVDHARAECIKDAYPSAIQAKLDTTVLPQLNRLLLDQAIEVPITPTSLNVASCGPGLGNISLDVTGGAVSVALDDLTITPQAGVANVFADFVVGVTLDTSINTCGIVTPCTLNASIDQNTITSDVRLAVSPDTCDPTITLENLALPVTTEDVDTNVDACGLEVDVVGVVLDVARDYILQQVLQEVPDVFEDALNDVITQAISEFASASVEAGGIVLEVASDGVGITPDGFELSLQAKASYNTKRRDCVTPSPSTPAPPAAPLAPPVYGPGPISVAVSNTFVQNVIEVAWESGWLCVDTRDFGLTTLGDLLDPLIAGVELQAAIIPTQVPEIFVDPASSQSLGLELMGLNVLAAFVLGDQAPIVVGAEADGDLLADIKVVDDRSVLSLTPNQINLSRIIFELPNDTGTLIRKESLTEIVEDVVMPLIADSTGGIPLTSVLYPNPLISTRLDSTAVGPDYVQADLDIWVPDALDTTPPTTALTLPSDIVGASFDLTTQSVDNDTPGDFLRHVVTVDGEELLAPLPGRTFPISALTEGPHTIEVAAIDLRENVDPDSIVFQVLSDTLPPVLTITKAPLGVLTSRRGRVEFEVEDNLAQPEEIQVTYTVLQRGPLPNTDVVLQEGTLAVGETLRLQDLPEDSNIGVQLRATDAVGNAATAEANFAVNSDFTFSCSYQSAPSALVWVGIVGLVLVRRRRTRRCA